MQLFYSYKLFKNTWVSLNWMVALQCNQQESQSSACARRNGGPTEQPRAGGCGRTGRVRGRLRADRAGAMKLHHTFFLGTGFPFSSTRRSLFSPPLCTGFPISSDRPRTLCRACKMLARTPMCHKVWHIWYVCHKCHKCGTKCGTAQAAHLRPPLIKPLALHCPGVRSKE